MWNPRVLKTLFFISFLRRCSFSTSFLSTTFQSVVCSWIIVMPGLCWRLGSPTKKTRSRWWSLSFSPLFSLLASLATFLCPSSRSLHHSSVASIWIGPSHCYASSPVSMNLHNQMVRLFGAINSLRESVGTCLQQRFGGAWLNVLNGIPL